MNDTTKHHQPTDPRGEFDRYLLVVGLQRNQELQEELLDLLRESVTWTDEKRRAEARLLIERSLEPESPEVKLAFTAAALYLLGAEREAYFFAEVALAKSEFLREYQESSKAE